MPAAGSRLECAGCGARPSERDPWPFRCPGATAHDDVDHLIVRVLDPGPAGFPQGDDPNPFVRYRTLLHSYHRARARGVSNEEFVQLVRELDARVAAVDGRAVRVTPLADAPGLAAELGFAPGAALLLKNETGGVAGSHKARHLFGLALHLEVAERIGLATRAEADRRGLAIASCGNAALAAATIARATGRPLTAYIPADANPRIVARLGELGARTAVCRRDAGASVAVGDPCVIAFRRAVGQGALPFCCQGNENGLAIEGGETLPWEIVSALAGGDRVPERLFVQVGGGALASACIQGLREAQRLGALARLPRLHAVQSEGAAPLRRAYVRVRARVLARLGLPRADENTSLADDEALAGAMRPLVQRAEVCEELSYAARHRSEFMWAWESEPRSVAHGILDDETYDWHAVVAGMIESGGYPVTVSEARLIEARDAVRAATGIPADATGAAGAGGLLELRAHGLLQAGESACVLVTGAG